MTVTVGTGTASSKYVKEEYPVVEGTTLGTTKLKDDWFLEPEESIVSQRDKVGM